MSAQCPHYVRTTSHEGYMKKTYIPREMLCGHSADIVRTLCADIVWTYISRDICHVHTISLFGFQLLSVRPVRESEGCTKTKRLKNYKMVIVGEVCVVSLLFGASCKIVISPLLFGLENSNNAWLLVFNIQE